MSWPLPSDFSSILQNPEVAFGDPRLQACQVEQDAAGHLRTWAGAFAMVYRGIDAGDQRPFALRLFNTESPERGERYQRIAAYLKEHKVDCLVEFEYRDKAICSSGDGQWYPLLIMDWVDGASLFDYVRARCLAGKAPSLAKAAKHWATLVQELADAQIAHGDLEPANVLVTRTGRLKLIDYDGLCVPELVGRRTLEMGTPPYQHPRRCAQTRLTLGLDNFPALLIYVALRALAAEPRLWGKYVEKCGYDKLLFKTEDFATRKASTLYADLKQSPDPEVHQLARILWAAAAADINIVPKLSKVIASLHQPAGTPASMPAAAPAVVPDGPIVPNRQERGEGPQVILKVVAGPIEGKQFVLDRHDTFLFGRGKDCHARIQEDGHVSRHHFLLEVMPPMARIRDLGSRNGTLVNGVKLGGRETGEGDPQVGEEHHSEVELRHGDQITVGCTTIHVTIQEPAATETAATIDLPAPSDGMPVPGGMPSLAGTDGAPCTHGPHWSAEGRHDLSAGPSMRSDKPAAIESAGQLQNQAPSPAIPTASAIPSPAGAASPQNWSRAAQPAYPSIPCVPGYQIYAEIGRGRLGIVYQAMRQADGQPVALKIVVPTTAASEQAYRTALLAVDRVRPLRHPHIAALWESGLAGSSVYLVTDYCDAGSLRQWLNQRGGLLSWAEVGPLMLQCLDALQYAHAHDVIHRGIHPLNILFAFTPGARTPIAAKFSDFALAYNLQSTGLAGMMAMGEGHVDYHFIPREQVTDFRGCSAASDLWSLAATFYHALSGQFPLDFHGRDPIEVILHDHPQPLCQRNPAVPPALAEVIDRALVNEPLHRYQSAAAMKAALEAALPSSGVQLR